MIKRDFYLQKLINKKDNNRVKVITGIRRCDKLELLFTLYKKYLLSWEIKEDQIIVLQLDGDDSIKYRNLLLLGEHIRSKVTNNKKKYYVLSMKFNFAMLLKILIIDEQEPSITFVDTLLGLMKMKNLDIYVTTSNSKMLSSEILTQFSDRDDKIDVYPFSYDEIYYLFDSQERALNHYINYGGVPEVYNLKLILKNWTS
ncbi:AAA family ATPase [Mycoplasma putrefaciens]|uniref:AAA family ATPase n=1 Tax=Mycoplasma putrefaciens TaxID=2123 RepID=UPI0003A117DA|nr:AAA family ATPase [Mycoplasma putrefaciens]